MEAIGRYIPLIVALAVITCKTFSKYLYAWWKRKYEAENKVAHLSFAFHLLY